MTAQKESVVTPERFATGLSYKEWRSQIDRNEDKFDFNYEATTPDAEEVAKIKAVMAKPHGPAKALALAEAFCPDVFRGLPAIAKMCEATGLELKCFFRDQNQDIMNEFLNKGEFQSVPTVVFYTAAGEYIGHWIERPKLADEQMPVMRAISSKMRDESISAEERARLTEEYAAFQKGPIWGGWRDAAIKECRELFEEKSR